MVEEIDLESKLIIWMIYQMNNGSFTLQNKIIKYLLLKIYVIFLNNRLKCLEDDIDPVEYV